MATKIMLKHPASGMLKKGYYGYSWTYLFFGFWVPLIRGELGTAALHLLFGLVTFGGWNIVMSFLYNKQYMTRMLVERNYVLAGSDSENEFARMKLGIAPTGAAIAA
ncbi:MULTISPECIES: hypothetical protein [Cupriavidus]|uniref:hypothetical protein n=1 Tax=Cupriavidus TaxID=106589 RepID=UPI00048AEF63|nr:hypothetical protein [Cupriavidus sp. amp6]